jgi:hypothetical protein
MSGGNVFKIALAASLASQPAIATGYDGASPFTCAASVVASCTSDGGCEKETAETINLPPLLTFDLTEKKITGTRPSGEPLATSIDNVRHVQDSLALQGVQGRIVWSVTVDRKSGEMALAAMGDGVGYIAFGACHSG